MICDLSIYKVSKFYPVLPVIFHDQPWTTQPGMTVFKGLITNYHCSKQTPYVNPLTLKSD